MHFTKIVKRCLISSLKVCDTFIQVESVEAFEKGQKVDVFMILAEAAYGFSAVSLITGYFKFDYNFDREVVKVI